MKKNNNWLIELHVLMVNSMRIHIVIKCCWWPEYFESCFPDNSILIASQYVSFSKLFFLCIKLFKPLYPITQTIHLLSFLVLEKMTDSNAEKFKAYVNFIIIIILYFGYPFQDLVDVVLSTKSYMYFVYFCAIMFIKYITYNLI